MATATLNLLYALTAAGLFALAGYGLVGVSPELRRSGFLARGAYAYLLGVVVVGWALWAASHLLGVPLTRSWVTGIWLALAVVLGGIGVAGRLRSPAQDPRPTALRLALVGVLLLGALVSAAAIARAATRPVEGWDGRMTWSAHARYIRHAESADAPVLREGRWLVMHPDYPILMPLAQVATLQLWSHEDERAIRPLYALMLPALLLVAWDCGRRLGGELPALLVVALASGLPMLAFEREGGAASTYSDLPLACFWGGGLLLLVSARRPGAVALPAGILLAGAVLTKNEGLPLAVLALISAGPLLMRDEISGARPRERLRQRLGVLLAVAAPPLSAFILVRSWAAGIERRLSEDYLSGLNPERLSDAGERLGVIVPEILSQSLSFDSWLVFWALFPLVLAAGVRGLRSQAGGALLLSMLGATALYLVAYLASPWGDLETQVRVTWNRFLLHMLLPALGLICLAVADLVGRLAGSPRVQGG